MPLPPTRLSSPALGAQIVVPFAANDGVVAAVTEHDVVAVLAIEVVIAVRAEEGVDAVAAKRPDRFRLRR